jgi:hypothetical protein
MSLPPQPIQIPLTEEQQALIQRLSGQHAQILELVPESTDGMSGVGRTMRFHWRLSTATGIPRQQWEFGGGARPPSDPEASA